MLFQLHLQRLQPPRLHLVPRLRITWKWPMPTLLNNQMSCSWKWRISCGFWVEIFPKRVGGVAPIFELTKPAFFPTISSKWPIPMTRTLSVSFLTWRFVPVCLLNKRTIFTLNPYLKFDFICPIHLFSREIRTARLAERRPLWVVQLVLMEVDVVNLAEVKPVSLISI